MQNTQKDDFNWFVANMAELFGKYGHSFLAIKNRKILKSYPSYAEAVRETRKTEDLGSFIVQECGSDESAYTNYIYSLGYK